MSAHDDGGPAFPGGQFRTVQRVGEEPRDIPAGPQGMTLRDWYAGQALAGLMAYADTRYGDGAAAVRCLAVADAIIARRKIEP